MIFSKFLSIWQLMRVREKKNFIFLIILSAFLPIVELLGIGTVFGFIDLTLNLNNLEETFFSKKFKHFFLFNDPQLLIFYGGILVIILSKTRDNKTIDW